MKCPICESRQTTIAQTHFGPSPFQPVFGVSNIECQNCGFVFSDFIHDEVISLMYTKFCRTGLSDEEIKDLRDYAKISARSQLKTIQPFLPEKIGRVLDFGGGYGDAARLFLPFSDEVYVVEQDPVCIEHIKQEPRLNLVTSEDLEKENFVGFFDLVVLSNVLEHMSFPIRQVQYFSRIIANSGFLFVEIPSEAEFLKKSAMQMQQHITFFSPDTFRLLIERQGSFDITELRTCGPSIDDMVEQRTLLHEPENQNNPNGWVIRALLQNNRPKLDVAAMNIDFQDCQEILANLSENLLRMNTD